MAFRKVCEVSEIGGAELLGRPVDGTRVVVCRVGEELFALEGVCSHERAYLDEGSLDGYLLYCPLHYSAFDIRNGEVAAPPADRNLRSFPVKIEGGCVWVDLDGGGVSGQEKGRGEADSRVGSDEGVPSRVAVPLVSFLERSVRLAGVTDLVHGRLGRWRKRAYSTRLGGLCLDLLHGRLGLGHPLHPAATDLPIGLWIAASVVDIWGGHADVALVLGAVGAAGGLVAVASGIADWSVTDGPDRRVGFVHGSGNVVALGLQGVALYGRAAGLSDLALGFGLASVTLVVLAGYLGGHLVFARGTMVDHTAWQLGPLDWSRAAPLEDLPDGAGVAVTVEGRNILLARSGGTVLAIDGLCSHAGALLNCPGGEPIAECPLHGSRFRMTDGRAVRGPASFAQPVLQARVADGWVEVRSRRARNIAAAPTATPDATV